MKLSAELLAPNVKQYIFISTISVYAKLDGPAPTRPRRSRRSTTRRTRTSRSNYGALKALCEQAAEAAMPGRVANLRPGLIIGPGDPTGRFTHWPTRMAEGGEVLAPGRRQHADAVHRRPRPRRVDREARSRTARSASFNALGPERQITMKEVLDACNAAGGNKATLTWVDADFLDKQEVSAWGDMPMWIDAKGEMAGFGTMSNARAVKAGLTFRPIARDGEGHAGVARHAARRQAHEARARRGSAARRRRRCSRRGRRASSGATRPGGPGDGYAAPMRIGSIVVAAVLALTVVSCKSEQAAARKLRKMDVHATIDDRGRLKLTFRLFDAKHEQMPVTGSYTAEVAKPDGSVLCKAAGELAPSDFSDKGTHKAQWADAGCPADPGVDELKVNVKLTVKDGAVAKEGKEAKEAEGSEGHGHGAIDRRGGEDDLRAAAGEAARGGQRRDRQRGGQRQRGKKRQRVGQRRVGQRRVG